MRHYFCWYSFGEFGKEGTFSIEVHKKDPLRDFISILINVCPLELYDDYHGYLVAKGRDGCTGRHSTLNLSISQNNNNN